MVTPAQARRRKRAAAAWAKAHSIPLPRGFSWQPGYIGKPARTLVAAIQRKAKLPLTGQFDTRTIALLFPPKATPTIREKIVAGALWGVQHASQIGYTQGGSRMHAVHTPFALPLETDCSAFVTLLYSWAGAPDPNGRGYDGFGYTGTLLAHCRHIALKDAKPGDLILWGINPGHHVAVIVDDAGTDNPLLVSHGKDSDPQKVSLKAETAAQRFRPISVLTVF